MFKKLLIALVMLLLALNIYQARENRIILNNANGWMEMYFDTECEVGDLRLELEEANGTLFRSPMEIEAEMEENDAKSN